MIQRQEKDRYIDRTLNCVKNCISISFAMEKRNLLDDEDGESIVSSTYFCNSGPQVEEATLSWRNDPLYKYVSVLFLNQHA